MLEINQLTKNYKGFSLGPVDLSVDGGCALGLVGANGAGKTTFFRSLIGTIKRDDGSVLIDNELTNDASGEWRQKIGYVGDYAPFFDNWTGAKNLAAFANYYPDWSHHLAKEFASRLNLDLTKKVKQYSTGNRTKLAIVAALCHQPQLIILDEPANGLDPVARDVFMEILYEQLETGDKSLLYATHHISEIENLADRLVFVSQGAILRDAIKEDLAESWRRITFRAEKNIDDIPHAVSQSRDHSYQEVISENGNETVMYLNQRGIDNIEISRLSIERIAIEILKSSARELDHV